MRAGRTAGGVLLMAAVAAVGAAVPPDPVAATPGRAPAAHVVQMRNFAFSPARLEVAVGDTVLFENRDAAPHTATDSAGRWDSGEVPAGGGWRVVVKEPGQFPYVCAYHPSMRGTLEVHASPERSTPEVSP